MTSPKLQKASFYTILILLLLFLPITGYSLYLKSLNKKPATSKDNVNKEMYFDGALWFYNSQGEILGTYPCQNTYCSYAVSYEEDFHYPLLTHQSEEESYLPIINQQYVFISDHETKDDHSAFLYDIQKEIAYKEITYASIHQYQIGIEDNLFIVEDQNHHFGVLQIDSFASPILEIKYDYVGMLDQVSRNNKILGDYFVVLEDGEWKILDRNEAELTSSITEPIVTFNGEYIITNQDGVYHVKDYQGNNMIEEDFTYLSFVDKYLQCQTDTELYLYDFVTKSAISEVYEIKKSDDISVEVNGEEIQILINNRLQESISLT